jgi:hypothetical protein
LEECAQEDKNNQLIQGKEEEEENGQWIGNLVRNYHEEAFLVTCSGKLYN